MNKQDIEHSFEQLEAVATYQFDGSPLSFVHDLKWDYSEMEKAKSGKSLLVSFESTPSEYRREIQETLHSMSELYEEKEKVFPSKSQIKSWKSGLTKIALCLGNCNWKLLEDDYVFKKFEKSFRNYCLKENYSKTSIGQIITSLNKLTEFKLCNRAFEGEALRSLVKARIKEQYIAIPIGLYQPLLKSAIETIEKYYPYRHEINEAMSQAHSIATQAKKSAETGAAPSTIEMRIQRAISKISHNIPDFNISRDGICVSKIQADCALVLFAFSGVRDGELKSFNKASYQTKETSNKSVIATLRGETSKGEDGIPKTVTWQTHPIVKDALELAHDMTDYLRELYGVVVQNKFDNGDLSESKFSQAKKEIKCTFIATKPSSVKSHYVKGGFDRVFNKLIRESNLFAQRMDVEEFNRLNPTREGQLEVGKTLPKLTPHDFRRTFAVFFKRYGFGTAASIKFQYKHQNINMSNYYANNAILQQMEDILLDKDLLLLLSEEGIRVGVDIFNEIYNESTQLSGLGGERIQDDKFQKLKGGHLVFMNRGEIERLVRNGTLSVVKLPTGGYCLNSSCSRICGINQFASEFKPCEHIVITDKEAKKVLYQNNRLIEKFRSLNVGDAMMNSILIALKQKIKRNEILLKQHELKFENFDDSVIVSTPVQEV